MNRKFLIILLAVTLGALGLFALGCEMCCNSSQGAGTIVITDPDTNDTHRATFNYKVECIGSYADNVEANSTRTITGRLQYMDHGAWKKADGTLVKVSIDAAIDNVVGTREAWTTAGGKSPDPYYNFLSIPDPKSPAAGVFCAQSYPSVGIFRGHYKPRPESLGDGGIATVMVMDNGKGGPSAEDRFEIRLSGGVFDGYKQRGVLAGGNVRAQ